MMQEETTVQSHVHEFEGSTQIAEAQTEPHNHRFAGVSSEVIPIAPDHVHVLFTSTDFFDHLHQIAAITGQPIDVGNGKHIHFVSSITTLDDGHFHDFQVATLIDAPLV